jgi:hypothetical protein
MYFQRNQEFGSSLSQLRNFGGGGWGRVGGGLNPPPSVRRCGERMGRVDEVKLVCLDHVKIKMAERNDLRDK